MAYDIYGNPLRPGYCEAHPDVQEEWPCYIDREMSESMDREAEYWRTHEREDARPDWDDLTPEEQAEELIKNGE